MLYKVLDLDGSAFNGGKGKWNLPNDGRPGEWMPHIDNLVLCKSGYHLCSRDNLILWLGPTIYEAEGHGLSLGDAEKEVWQEARLIRRVEIWNQKTARLFAADCADHVLPIFEKKFPGDERPRKAIQAARDFAYGKISDAARAAARDAAWDAARDAAWAAARDAARDAAWDAARDVEQKWQTEKLFEYLEKK